MVDYLIDDKRPYAPSLTTCPKTKNCGFIRCFGGEGDPLAPLLQSLFLTFIYLQGEGHFFPRMQTDKERERAEG